MPSLKRVRVENNDDDTPNNIVGGHEDARSQLLHPLSYTGHLDAFTHLDLTPVIGREYSNLQVSDLLNGGDAMIRDLAVTSTSKPIKQPHLFLEYRKRET
jgi:hypothetical protein